MQNRTAMGSRGKEGNAREGKTGRYEVYILFFLIVGLGGLYIVFRHDVCVGQLADDARVL